MTFCKFLKNGLVYNNNTTHFTVSPCCYFAKNYVIDPLQDVNAQLVKYQQEWQNEDTNTACTICINAEQSGLYSYRKASFDQITTDHNHIDFLTVAVNKKCNLACPSCGPDSSSFWYQENLRNKTFQSDNIIKLHQEDRENIITEKFLSLLNEQNLSEITYIKFGGGEPLMSDVHAQILKLIPFPERVTIQYTSNFSIMPSKAILKLWAKFKLIKWIASIDGINEQFTFLRWPYDYKNLEKFINKAKEIVPTNVIFGTEHTINALNAFYYPEFELWFKEKLGTNREGDPSDLNLHSCTGVLSLNSMPDSLRTEIKNKLGENSTIMSMINQHPYLGNTIAITDYLNNLDKIRNQNWRSTFNEIQGHFI